MKKFDQWQLEKMAQMSAVNPRITQSWDAETLRAVTEFERTRRTQRTKPAVAGGRRAMTTHAKSAYIREFGTERYFALPW